MSNSKIKVLIVDDSALIRQLLTDILSEADGIEVVGTAQDPIFAMNKVRNLQPDVITMDVEMPRMNGLVFLEELMKDNPIPVVMVSALTKKGCDTTLKALELGAVDYITKPFMDMTTGIKYLGEEIIRKVKIAAKAKVRTAHGSKPDVKSKTGTPARSTSTNKIIAIGASTGGTQAITEILMALPGSVPGIIVVQHMPPLFTNSFAERLNVMSQLDIKEASFGNNVKQGQVLIAPGNKHMAIKKNGDMYYTEIIDGPLVNFVRPSVDVLFRAVARYAGKNAIGIILTGMGEDGARGLLEMKEAGAFTIAQDEETSVVFGMPKKAIELDAVDKVAPLEQIPEILMKHL